MDFLHYPFPAVEIIHFFVVIFPVHTVYVVYNGKRLSLTEKRRVADQLSSVAVVPFAVFEPFINVCHQIAGEGYGVHDSQPEADRSIQPDQENGQ